MTGNQRNRTTVSLRITMTMPENIQNFLPTAEGRDGSTSTALFPQQKDVPKC
ncbi:hypothetical protein V7x_12620 [Crateriforma conspicua]|uniref:Uncharacterized protein n=1 Tax=Crateriforma conspicua TaxID=2527996 RepID=A0A5C6FXD9_9PLAN|nr:hypothetical protein V7x_12620 [Crateriforma conspicua]